MGPESLATFYKFYFPLRTLRKATGLGQVRLNQLYTVLIADTNDETASAFIDLEHHSENASTSTIAGASKQQPCSNP